MKRGDILKVIYTSEGRSGMVAEVLEVSPTGEMLTVRYVNDGHVGAAHIQDVKFITDGVTNAAFSKPDDGEDCRA